MKHLEKRVKGRSCLFHICNYSFPKILAFGLHLVNQLRILINSSKEKKPQHYSFRAYLFESFSSIKRTGFLACTS